MALCEVLQCLCLISGCNAGHGLLTQVVRLAAFKAALPTRLQLLCNVGSVLPITGAFVVRQQGQTGLRLKARALQFQQCFFGTIQQPGFKVVQRQSMLGTVPVVLAQVATRQQMLVNPDCTFVLTTTAEQIAQRKVQF